MQACTSYCSSLPQRNGGSAHPSRRRNVRNALQTFSCLRQVSVTYCSSTSNATFKRLVAGQHGPSFRSAAKVLEAPIPVPGPEQVLVRVEYAGINGGHETFQVRGDFAFSAVKELNNFPLGAEGCGTVVDVGPGVSDIQVGQAVAINRSNCFAEYVLAPSGGIYPVSRSCPEVVALTLSGTTAFAALEVTAGIQAGEVVLVTAASGGTGHLAVQLAKLAGCTVVATCSSKDKANVLRELGVDRVVNYKQEDLKSVLASEYPNGVDVVYECVGGELLQAALESLAPGGRLLQVGYISQYPHMGFDPGSLPSLSLGDSSLPSVEQWFWNKETIQLEGSRTIYGNLWPKDLRSILHGRQRMFDLWECGQLRVLVDLANVGHGVEAIPDAVEYMLKGRHVGKVVLKMQ